MKSSRGYVAAQRRNALRQMELNRAAYEADATRHRTSIRRLTARIRNAMLAYLQPTPVRAASGALDAGRIWRGVYLDDDKVFTRILQSDPGDLSVDILLDASSSQIDRQAVVAAQGYMIAESLTRRHIPVRVSSFCSLSGYTVVTRYRDYYETGKNDRIFNYFTTGATGTACHPGLGQGTGRLPQRTQAGNPPLRRETQRRDPDEPQRKLCGIRRGQRHPEHRHGDPVPDLQGHQRHVRFHRE